ncbi:hypothetical protein U1E44_15675 [Arenibacter sp. GZD96]|uniref:hypothetical protein n=1 Tax=Aurantibrevibacter litoralis TaxID=3106030 RepID=UPI002AFF2FA6|nr:hypothetical protein [Arenibacter sp. GZD-96]MEA1787541.1 hypothetical protein [Arenibacter sp. GZD-96]
MKTIIKFSAVVAFMFVTVAGMANEPKLSVVANEAAKSLVFKLDGQSGSATVRIIDAQNNVIFSQNFAKEGNYSKKFDFKNVASGTYYLTMENDLRVISYTVAVNDADLKVVSRKENAKPVFRTKGEVIFLNLLNLEQKEVSIKVYDSSYRLLYSEVVADKLLVEKAFNFESAKKDSYTVVVKDKTNTYYKDIVVN